MKEDGPKPITLGEVLGKEAKPFFNAVRDKVESGERNIRVVLVGPTGEGKTTLADYLVDEVVNGYGFDGDILWLKMGSILSFSRKAGVVHSKQGDITPREYESNARVGAMIGSLAKNLFPNRRKFEIFDLVGMSAMRLPEGELIGVNRDFNLIEDVVNKDGKDGAVVGYLVAPQIISEQGLQIREGQDVNNALSGRGIRELSDPATLRTLYVEAQGNRATRDQHLKDELNNARILASKGVFADPDEYIEKYGRFKFAKDLYAPKWLESTMGNACKKRGFIIENKIVPTGRDLLAHRELLASFSYAEQLRDMALSLKKDEPDVTRLVLSVMESLGLIDSQPQGQQLATTALIRNVVGSSLYFSQYLVDKKAIP